MNPAIAAEPHSGTVALRIPAQAEWVAVARLAVAAVASRMAFSVDEIEDIKLAIAEACTNCIEHGTALDSIEITSTLGDGELQVTVRDRGMNVDLDAERDEARFVDGNRTEELGVFLIRALMDHVTYRVDPREGTELVMSKRVTR